MTELKRTALYDEHKAVDARLVPFAGWEMPVQYGPQYGGVIGEVRAVREGCGLFDVSHMGQFDVSGPDVSDALNRVVSADWSNVPVGRVAYALLLNEQGGVIDDIMGYHLAPDHWFLVVNASRADVDEAHLRAHLPGLSLSNRYQNQAMLAIQGATAAALLTGLTMEAVGEMQWRDCRETTLCGAQGLLARGGYTGCDGFEWMFDAKDAPRVWRVLLEAGAVPCGLGARDVLRLEAALPLYGHELREAWTPGESGCGWAVKKTGEFIGGAALAGRGPAARRIKALKMKSRAIAREGYAVFDMDGVEQPIGEVTSGTLSPTLGTGIALAMLPAGLNIGDCVRVAVRAGLHEAEIVTPPFVAHSKK